MISLLSCCERAQPAIYRKHLVRTCNASHTYLLLLLLFSFFSTLWEALPPGQLGYLRPMMRARLPRWRDPAARAIFRPVAPHPLSSLFLAPFMFGIFRACRPL